MRSFGPMDGAGRLAPASGIAMARFGFGFGCCAVAAATSRQITNVKRMKTPFILRLAACGRRRLARQARPQDAPRWPRERLSAGRIATIYHPGILELRGIVRRLR